MSRIPPGPSRALPREARYVSPEFRWLSILMCCTVLKKTHSLFYKPFPYFSDDSEWEHTPGIKGLANITQLLATERYNDARKASAELIKQALAGLRYLETCVIVLV